MRKLLLLSVAAALVFVAACKKNKADDKNGGGTTVDNTVFSTATYPAYVYFGGTWCPPCGAYGKPTKEKLKEDALNSDVTFLSYGVWNTDAFKTTENETSATMMGVTGVPTAFIGASGTLYKVGFTTSNTTNQTTQQGNINTTRAIKAKVNGHLTAKINGDKIDVTAKIKNWEASSDEFFISVALTENNLIATQASDGSTTKQNIHDAVVRIMNGANIFGESIVKAPAANQVSTKTISFTKNSGWQTGSMKVNMLIWKKDGAGKYALENSHHISLQ